MKKIGAFEAKNRLSELLEAAENGEEIMITKHGRPVAKLKPSEVVLIGARDLDAEERVALRESGILVITMRDIDEMGMSAAAHQALEKLSRM